MNKAKEVLEVIEREDNLPSNASNLFRDILRYEDCGWRELDIARQLLNTFLDMSEAERIEILNVLGIE